MYAIHVNKYFMQKNKWKFTGYGKINDGDELRLNDIGLLLLNIYVACMYRCTFFLLPFI